MIPVISRKNMDQGQHLRGAIAIEVHLHKALRDLTRTSELRPLVMTNNIAIENTPFIVDLPYLPIQNGDFL